MSVWEKTSYKLEVARAIYENYGSEIQKILGPKCSPYLNPKGELHFLTGESSWEDVAFECNWDLGDPDQEYVDEFKRWTCRVKSWVVGTAAIYRIIHAASRGFFPVRDQYPYGVIEQRADAMCSVLSPSTSITPRTFYESWKNCDKIMVKRSRIFENLSESWKYVYRSWVPKDVEFEPLNMDRFFSDEEGYYEAAYSKNLVILRGRENYTHHGLILTRTHVSFLVEAAMRISNLLDYAAREHVADTPMRLAIAKMLRLTIEMGAKSRKSNADKVVQAFHKARAFTQMILFSNVEEDARDDALKEFQTKGLNDVLDLEAYTQIFTTLPKGSWLEILHVYKWMPPPDFDATSAFEELHGYHYSTRVSGLDDSASDLQKELWKLVVKERKLNIAVAYEKSYNQWPEGLEICNSYPTSESLDAWEPFALFSYETYGKDIASQIKDKSTVLGTINEEVGSRQNHPDKNFLLWFLRHYGDIDTRKEAKYLHSGCPTEDNFARVAYKGEAHKPGSRLFFMAPPILRILLGELEGNISRIASVYPASLQGITTTVRDVRLHSLFDISTACDRSRYKGPSTCFVVTFDLSKFSPRFNPAVLIDLHKFWSKVFNYPPIASMATIGANGAIVHTTNKLVMQYKNKGADLEGFRGRMMTLFHADLISAACRYAEKKGYIVDRAFSAVFIDDGAVRVMAKGEGEEAKENAQRFLECLQDVYAAAGQENHPNKTIVSFVGGELLSEQFVFGQKLKCPIKAAMRLYPKYENPAASIVDEFQALFSTTQGSCKEGATWAVAYRRLCDAYMKSIYRWARADFKKLDPVRFAFKMVTPKSAGGFGFPSLQSIVSTTALDMTLEGFGIINKAGEFSENYAPIANYIMNRPVLRRDPLSILRDPLRIRFAGPCIAEGRLAHAIAKKLKRKEGPWSRFVNAYASKDLHEHATRVAEALLARDVFSAPACIRAWEATPLAYIENVVMKFQKSDSIQAVLSQGEITRIRKANKRDVYNLVRCFF